MSIPPISNQARHGKRPREESKPDLLTDLSCSSLKKQKSALEEDLTSTRSFACFDEPLICHLLNFFDVPELVRFADTCKRGQLLAHSILISMGKSLLGKKFRLQHENEMGGIKYEFALLKQELHHLAQGDLRRYESKGKAIQEAIIKDSRDTLLIRPSMSNLRKLPFESIAVLFHEEYFYQYFPRILDSLAIAFLQQETKPLFHDATFNKNEALKHALSYHQPNILQLLLSDIATIDFTLASSLLYQAVKEKRHKVIKRFLQAYKHCLAEDQMQTLIQTCLAEAVVVNSNNTKMLAMLKEYGANFQDTADLSPPSLAHFGMFRGSYHVRLEAPLLFLAANRGSLENVEFLLKHGADPNGANRPDRRPLCGIIEVPPLILPDMLPKMKLLLRHGADPEKCLYPNGESLLHRLLAMQPPLSLVEAIICNPDKEKLKRLIALQDPSGDTPLLYALRHNCSLETINLLLLRGADVHHKVADGSSTLHIAAAYSTPKVLERLINEGCSLEEEDHFGQTPIFNATNHYENFKYLERRANIRHITTIGDTLLHIAAMRGAPEVLDLLLESGFSLEKKNNDGQTPIFRAVPNFNRFFFLLSRGASIYHTDRFGTTMLHFAAKFGSLKVLEALIKVLGLELKDNRGQTPLFYAVSQTENFRFLLEKGANTRLNPETRYGATILHIAARDGSPEVLNMLLNTGSDLESEDEDEETPLFYAINKLENFKFLLNKGADIHHRLKIEDGATVIHIAARDGSLNVLEALIETLGLELKDKHGLTPLFYAVSEPENFKLLLDKGADTHHRLKSEDEATILHIAARDGSLKVLQMLLDAGLDLELKDKHGLTPLFYAVSEPENFKLLLDKGADIGHRLEKEDGATILHMAAQNGLPKVLKMLIRFGLDLELEDNHGHTPLFYAVSEPENFKLLLEKGANLRHNSKRGKTALAYAIFDCKLPSQINDELFHIVKTFRMQIRGLSNM
ncbi:MAG: ankyrin repeat domain-containing protein [Parachlamydiaceae bacterium]